MGKSRLLAEVVDDRSQPRHQSRQQRSRSERDGRRACGAAGGAVRRSRAAARPRRARHASCAARATVLAVERPAAAARARGARVAAADLHRRRALGRRRNGCSDSHAADATHGTADRLGHRPSPPREVDTARARARTAEAEGRAHDRSRPARRRCGRAAARRTCSPRSPISRFSKQLAEADGSPFLVVETLLGLQEENRIRVVDGRAELIDKPAAPARAREDARAARPALRRGERRRDRRRPRSVARSPSTSWRGRSGGRHRTCWRRSVSSSRRTCSSSATRSSRSGTTSHARRSAPASR